MVVAAKLGCDINRLGKMAAIDGCDINKMEKGVITIGIRL